MARTTGLIKKKVLPKTMADDTKSKFPREKKKSESTQPDISVKASKPLKRKNEESTQDASNVDVKLAKKAKTEASTSKPTTESSGSKSKLHSTKEAAKVQEDSRPVFSKSKPTLPTQKDTSSVAEIKSKSKPLSNKMISRPIPRNSKTKPNPFAKSLKKKKEASPEVSHSESDSEEEAEDDGDETQKPLKDDDEEKSEGGEDDGEDDDHLHGFSSDDGEDSSDEDDMNVDESTIDVGTLPTIAKDDASVKRKLEAAKRKPTEDKGVIYVGRLPHGFYEDQLKAYFSQFGDVTRLRVSRNKKTGKSKHYAFLEFDSSAVAKIVAETMDNYLILGHILRCKVISKEEVHPALWVGANRKWRPVPKDRVVRVQRNKERTEEEQEKAAKRLLKRQRKKTQRVADMGIKYDLAPVSYKLPKHVTV